MKINLKMMITVRIHHAWVLDQTDRWVRSDHITWRSQIGRSKLFLDRSEIGSVQVQSPVGPVRLHLKKCRSYALDRTGPRPNRGCPSLDSRKNAFLLIRMYLSVLSLHFLSIIYSSNVRIFE